MTKIRNSLNIFKQELKNSAFFQRVLSSYLLVSCIVFILFSLLLLLSSNREYFSTLEDMQEQTIAQAYNINQTTIKDIIAYCNGLIDKPTMTNILYGDTFSSSLALEATKLNDNMRNVSSLIRSVYFINFRTGTIIDHNDRTRISLHTDTEIFRILEEMTPRAAPLFCYPRTIDYREQATEYEDVPVLSIIFFPNKSGSMVINLDYQAYCKLLNTQENSNISIVLFNSQGRIMASSDPELFGLDVSQSDLYRNLQEKSTNRGSFSYDYEGSCYSVSYIKNEGLGITYFCTRENHFIYPENSHLLVLLLYSAVYILIGFVLSMLLSWIIYNPLRHLKAQITSHRAPAQASGEAGPQNDFAFISQAYQEVVDINTRLQHGSETVQKMKLYKQLLFGQESYALYASDLEALDASFPEINYAILLLGIDPTSMNAERDTGAGVFKYAIRNVAQELLSASIKAEYIELDSYYIVFLLNFTTLDTEKMVEILRQTQSFIEQHFDITFSAGLGDTVQDLTELSVSYSSALEAYSQRFLSGNRSIHTVPEQRLTSVADQSFPYEIADGMLSAIKSMSAPDAEKQSHAFFAAIRTYDIEQILSFILQLHFLLQKLEFGNYIQVSWDWTYRALERSSLKEIEGRMTQRCLTDIAQLTQIRNASSGKKELIQQIQALVAENIYNPELSVVFLASQVHLSVNYLRNIFKESTGDSLSNYINAQKIDLICNLLRNTDLSLADISDKLGFSTKNYFYTFFKKHIGMTPGDYRKKMREQPQLT